MLAYNIPSKFKSLIWCDLLSIEDFELEDAVAVAARNLHHEVVEVHLQSLGQGAGVTGPAQPIDYRRPHFGDGSAHATHDIRHGRVLVRLPLIRAGLLLTWTTSQRRCKMLTFQRVWKSVTAR